MTPRPRASGVLFVVVTLAALVGVAITASLGRWQLGRAAEKLAYEQTLTSRAALPALDGASLAKADAAGAAEDLRHRTVELEGLWLPAHTIYLDNRQMQGRPGFFVITPLQLRGTSAVVLVQSAYTAAKHGVVGLTRALALELATKGVTVNAVCPGYTETDLLKDSIARLLAALNAFEAWGGPLKPHFAYGELDKAQYTRAHLMHLANHAERVRQA